MGVGGVCTRFAPSPTGFLHLGHAASAKAAFGFARECGGVCLLRIEDIDQTRCRPEFEAAIYEDLAWLGFNWPEPVRRQSDHLGDYAEVIGDLRARGLIYRCFKTRKDILAEIARAPHGRGEVYLGTPLPEDEEAELLASGKPYAWRLSLTRCRDNLGADYDRLEFENNEQTVKAEPGRLGDVILARKDCGTSYHLACTHDDAVQGITDIVRGEDLLESTHIHRLLQALMGWPVPRYHHHKLLKGPDGRRYAKRDKSLTLRALRHSGAQPQEILAQTALSG